MANEGRRRILALLQAQGGFCAGCGNKVRQTAGNPDDPLAPTFDHFVPRSKGGTFQLGNGLLKHRRCNTKRGNGPPSGCDRIWLEVVRARRRKARKVALSVLTAEIAAAKKQQALETRCAMEAERRRVDGGDGWDYRLWGLVRL